MASYHALTTYHFLTNFLVGCCFFIAVCGVGDFLIKRLPYSFPVPLSPVLKAMTGFLSISLIIQLLAFGFWINEYSLAVITLALVTSAVRKLYQLSQSSLSLFKSLSKLPKQDLIWISCFLLCFLPILFYAILPSAKIDELFYHQLVAQRIVADGGMVFYRQPWEAAMPAHLLYNFSQVPLVYWGFPDAPNVVSLCFFSLFLWVVLSLFNQAQTPSFWKWGVLSLLCLGMYRLTFTTSGSHHFGDVAAFMGLYVVAILAPLKRKTSISAILTMQGIFLSATAGSKMSLLPYAILIGIYTLYEVWREDKFKIKHVTLLLSPLLIFYVPIVLWTYTQTHSPFGLLLSEYFDTKLIDKHLLASTLQAETVLHPKLSLHGKEALSYFPFMVLFSPLLFALSHHSRPLKIKVFIVFGLFLAILYAFHLIYNPRFWANLPASLLVLGALSPPTIKWPTVARQKLLMGATAIAAILPYLTLSYYYLYHLLPFPYNEATKTAYYKKFIPLYEDYKSLDKLLPADGCLFTQNRLNLVHAPRPIFRDSLDICNCATVYAFQCDTLLLPAFINTRDKKYRLGKLVYQNRQAKITIYRTPNKQPKTGTLSVYQLMPL
jgi:hypothetical protein